ncbi:hypothetical protein OH76DRAFT_1413410 [Lentinus brumalis]|uniref:Uncharacterized protein n=1 Tax=Lentinus brumalis TaxID=2498619 RepID=A0A371CHD3_9APHY|nr:hypothetical protein OH76DRAFT_1413410 [Polyporus brumalis]
MAARGPKYALSMESYEDVSVKSGRASSTQCSLDQQVGESRQDARSRALRCHGTDPTRCLHHDHRDASKTHLTSPDAPTDLQATGFSGTIAAAYTP